MDPTRARSLVARAAPALPALLTLAAIVHGSDHALARPTALALAASGLGVATWRVVARTPALAAAMDARPWAELAGGALLALLGLGCALLPFAAAAFTLACVGLLAGLAAAAFSTGLWAHRRAARIAGVVGLVLATLASALAVGFSRFPLVLLVPVGLGVLQVVLARRGPDGERKDATALLLALAFGVLALLSLSAPPSGPATLAASALGLAVGLVLGFASLRRDPSSASFPIPVAGLLYLLAAGVAMDAFGALSQTATVVLMLAAAVFMLRLLLTLRPIAARLERARSLRWGAAVLVGLLSLGPACALGSAFGIGALDGPTLAFLQLSGPLASLSLPLFFGLFLFGGVLTVEVFFDLAAARSPPDAVARMPVRAGWALAAAGLGFAAVAFLALRMLLRGWDSPLADALATGVYGGAALALVAGGLTLAARRGRGSEALPRRLVFLALFVLPVSLYQGYLLSVTEAYDVVPAAVALLLGWAALDTLSYLPERAEQGRWLAPRATWELILAVVFAVALGVVLNAGFHGVADTMETIDTADLLGVSLGIVALPLWRFVAGVRSRRKAAADDALATA